MRDAQERNALVSLASIEGLWDMNLRRIYFYISARVLFTVGLTVESSRFQSQDWIITIHLDDRERYYQCCREHLDSGGRIFDLEYWVSYYNDELSWIADRALTSRDSTDHAHRTSVPSLTSPTTICTRWRWFGPVLPPELQARPEPSF